VRRQTESIGCSEESTQIESWLEKPKRWNTPDPKRDLVPTEAAKPTPNARATAFDARVQSEPFGRAWQIQEARMVSDTLSPT